MIHPSHFRRPVMTRVLAGISTAIAALIAFMPVASAQNSLLLVNTESYHTVQSDGTTNVELRFGTSLDARIYYNVTTQKFQFTRSLHIQGNITATGSVFIQNNLTTTGSVTAKTGLSGASIRVSGPAAVHGALSASGSVRTDGDLTINDDQTAADAVLTFGNATANQTVKFLNTAQKFQFSKGINVVGTISGSALRIDGNANVFGNFSTSGSVKAKSGLSGSTLTVDGQVTIKNVNYNFQSGQGSAGTFLKNDGAGNLTWEATTAGNGSGDLISISPIFPNATYFASGSVYIGQLSNNYDTTNRQNYYRWATTKANATYLHNYWIAVRVRVPDNFSSWDPTRPIEMRYRTGQAANTANHVAMRVLDTAGTEVTLTGAGSTGSPLANTSWTTATITGLSSGTYTPKSFMTVLIKVAADNTGSADVGYINLNFETTTP